MMMMMMMCSTLFRVHPFSLPSFAVFESIIRFTQFEHQTASRVFSSMKSM